MDISRCFSNEVAGSNMVLVDRSLSFVASFTNQGMIAIQHPHSDIGQELLRRIYAERNLIRCSCTPEKPLAHICHGKKNDLYYWRKNAGENNRHDADCLLAHDIRTQCISVCQSPVPGALLSESLIAIIQGAHWDRWTRGRRYLLNEAVDAARQVEVHPGMPLSSCFTGRPEFAESMISRLRSSPQEGYEPRIYMLQFVLDVSEGVGVLYPSDWASGAQQSRESIKPQSPPFSAVGIEAIGGPYLALIEYKIGAEGLEPAEAAYIPVGGRFSLVPVSSTQSRWVFHALRKTMDALDCVNTISLVSGALNPGKSPDWLVEGPGGVVEIFIDHLGTHGKGEGNRVVLDFSDYSKDAIKLRYRQIYWAVGRAAKHE